ncbi:hypothetical protein [Natrononativus amylolyticus]|uniref:hypothetical protein n=1 Tax=Natrononativus amylolyticus TaxID=2963434 RepID=UPI0020CC2558|nr:hypothetical protein [Natrononativus amylolyticus]
MTETAIEWRIDAANSFAVRAVCYAWIGLFGGGLLAVAASAGVGAVAAAVEGNVASLALLALFVLVGGPFSLLYLLPAIRDADYRPGLSLFVPDPVSDPAETTAERYAAVFTPWRLLAAAVVGAVVLAAAVVVDPRALGVLIGALFVALVATSGLTTWGRLSPDGPTLEYRTGTVPLGGIDGARRLDVGGTVLYWVSYRSGVRSFGTPSLLAFTPEAARAFEAVLEDLEPADRAEPEPRNWPVTIVAGGMGVTFLAVAAGLLLVDVVPLAIGAYAALMTGLLGVLFVWAAYALT